MACKSMLEAMGYVVDGAGENADTRCDTFTLSHIRCTVCGHEIEKEKGDV